MESPEVSVIIPCKGIDRYTEECVEKCLNNLDYKNVEIIVLPDKKDNPSIEDNRVKVIPTGEKTPGAKRNIGIKNSHGDVVAFIDSDAYPERDWLKNAM